MVLPLDLQRVQDIRMAYIHDLKSWIEIQMYCDEIGLSDAVQQSQ